jgi:hypothetical protein
VREIRTLRATWRGLETWQGRSLGQTGAPVLDPTAQAALAAAKQEGLRLAVRARYVALAAIACLLPIINPAWDQLYYVVVLGLFALIAWGQVRVGGSACRGRSLRFCSATSRC